LDGLGHLEGRLRYPRALLRPDLPCGNGMMPPAAAKPCDQSMAFAILAWRPSVPQHPVCPTPRAPVLPVCCIGGGLGQQPVTKCHDLRQRAHRFGADDPVGVGQAQRDAEWPYQASIDQIRGGKGCAKQGHPLAVDGGVDQHAGMAEDRPVQHTLASSSRRLQPSRPVAPVIQVKQRKLEHILRLADAVAAGHEARAADRKQLLGA
jgi:hypothetical protein